MHALADSVSHKGQKNTKSLRRSLSIKARLIIGFVTIIVLLIMASATSLTIVTVTKQFANTLSEETLPAYDRLIDINSQLLQTQLLIRTWILSKDIKTSNSLAAIWENIFLLEKKVDALAKNWLNPDDEKKWADIKTLITSLKADQAKILNTADFKDQVAFFKSDNILISKNLLDLFEGPEIKLGQRNGGLMDSKYTKVNEGMRDVIEDMHKGQLIEYFLLIIGVLFSALVAITTIRNIGRNISNFRQHSGRITSGDLTQRILIESNDEMGELGQDLNTMTESLATITQQITEACHNMVTTVEEVNQAVNVQSAGASEQASSINEITASLEEIEKSSAQTLEKAKTLGSAAERTREKGEVGLAAVEQSILGMKVVKDKVQTIAQTILELSHQTQQVGEITAVVNLLAQQSKMLALNASIEAAKAGEAGKGFAVVATEVKNLAEQSEQSTAQVQKILENIRHATEKAVMVTEEGTKGVDRGMELVEQTGDIVRSLSDVIHETTIGASRKSWHRTNYRWHD
jgi:methyl-accepting chemotaxis protein